MLSLTKKTDYALIAVAFLAERPGVWSSARQVAKEHSVPLPVLMNILKVLNHQGLLESSRGARGGYRLAMDPGQISLARLIDAVEGPVRFVQCAEGQDDDCRCGLAEDCPIRAPVLRVHQRLNEFLETITLAELIAPAGVKATGAATT